MKVFINIREHRHWQPARDAVHAGIKKLGHEIITSYKDADLFITWTPWHGGTREAKMQYFIDHQKPVLVMENGWIPEIKGLKYYQLAFLDWNGRGEFYRGTKDRWRSWNFPILPWKNLEDSDEVNVKKDILVISQNGHNKDSRTSPEGWSNALQINTEREVIRIKKKVRPNNVDNIWAAITWSSNYAVELIRQGIPAFSFSTNNEMLHSLAKMTNVEN